MRGYGVCGSVCGWVGVCMCGVWCVWNRGLEHHHRSWNNLLTPTLTAPTSPPSLRGEVWLTRVRALGLRPPESSGSRALAGAEHAIAPGLTLAPSQVAPSSGTPSSALFAAVKEPDERRASRKCGASKIGAIHINIRDCQPVRGPEEAVDDSNHSESAVD